MSETKLTLDRSSRASREKESRRRPWTPPSRLDAPPAPEGFQHRWIRSEVNGFDDRQNVYGRLREGYELVRLEELPEEYQNMLPTIEDGKHAGVVSVGGLMLARIPVETVEERNAYFAKKARDQLTAVDNELLRENAHSSMRIQSPERSSRTTFRKPE
jgi:hypothetical protein